MAARKTKINDAGRFGSQSAARVKKAARFSVLIVCEGTKTEPDYFKAFESRADGVRIEIKVESMGEGARKVVEKAIELRKKNPEIDRVWAAFDKDEIPDDVFNDAIGLGIKNGIGLAWSNEAFELWFLYHFQNVTTGISRADYKDKISAAVNKSAKYSGRRPYEYGKSDKHNYEIMTICGSQEKAIEFARKMHESYGGDKFYARHNPCTTVYLLVNQLLGRDETLNNEIKAKVEG